MCGTGGPLTNLKEPQGYNVSNYRVRQVMKLTRPRRGHRKWLPRHKDFLIGLATHLRDDTFEVKISTDLIVEASGRDERTTKQSRRELAEAGVIECTPGKGQHDTTTYYMRALEQLSRGVTIDAPSAREGTKGDPPESPRGVTKPDPGGSLNAIQGGHQQCADQAKPDRMLIPVAQPNSSQDHARRSAASARDLAARVNGAHAAELNPDGLSGARSGEKPPDPLAAHSGDNEPAALSDSLAAALDAGIGTLPEPSTGDEAGEAGDGTGVNVVADLSKQRSKHKMQPSELTPSQLAEERRNLCEHETPGGPRYCALCRCGAPGYEEMERAMAAGLREQEDRPGLQAGLPLTGTG